MPRHSIYKAIVKAVMDGKLEEPFSNHDFREACPQFGEGTYNAFLWKHRKGNLKGESELFKLIEPNSFKLIRPIRYTARDVK